MILTVYILAGIIVFIVLQLLFVKFNGSEVPVPTIPRGQETFGSGKPLVYAVLGDSTAVGQGGSYEDGIARASAQHLAENHLVTLQNFAISGAQVGDVLSHQVPQAIEIKPDIVLLSMGANDVTHLTPIERVRSDTAQIISELRRANPGIRVVITGAPAMGTVPRFPEPLRSLAGLRADQMNRMFIALAETESIVFAPVARETGPQFDKNPGLFAPDKFHPNTAGYITWHPVLAKALNGTIN